MSRELAFFLFLVVSPFLILMYQIKKTHSHHCFFFFFLCKRIEAANYLPNWVDDDVSQGGVGGPSGCNNRCWIVNGKVCLIPPPPSQSLKKDLKNRNNDDNEEEEEEYESVDRLLSRKDALGILMKEGSDLLVASEDVQCAIRDRINRTDYSTTCVRKNEIPQQQQQQQPKKKDSSNKQSSPPPPPKHWHIAAVALPASVARFIEIHPSLVPLIVDSFCKVAPDYLKEQYSHNQNQSEKTNGDANNMQSTTTANDTQHDSAAATTTKSNTKSSSSSLGASFPYEQIVTLPITFTRTNYAELVTGRGIVPTFPVPKSYKSVELNRFQRQLRQSTVNHWAVNYEDDGYGGGIAGNKRRRNRFSRAVDVGVRLCAGLDWIVSNNHDGRKTRAESMNHGSAGSLEDSAIEALGEVERRLRIYWTRIDAEASASSGEYSEHDAESESSSLPWIEQAWQAGPNGLLQSTAQCSDKSLIQALESMSKCHVFNPELSQHLWEEPCPYTRPNVTLLNMVQSGIKSALKWQREKYDEDSFPMPREWEVDDDGWMDVNSLEELEEEMKNLSTRQKMNSAASGTNDSKKAESVKKPRRTTRRSRRKLAQSSCCQTEDGNNDKQQHGKAQPNGNVQQQSSNKAQGCLQPFGDDKDDLVTKNNTDQKSLESFNYTQDDTDKTKLEPENLMSQAVNINPTKFLNILHARLKKRSNSNQVALGDEKEESLSAVDDQDISKFFFDEDLDNDDVSDDSEGSHDGDMFDDNDYPHLQRNGSDDGEDPWSLHNIMEAMDHELRTDDISHPSIKNLSVASENNDDNGYDLGTEDSDLAILSSLLSSIDTQGDGPSPVTNILREMGICSSHLPE